jgi:hypothetical protein
MRLLLALEEMRAELPALEGDVHAVAAGGRGVTAFNGRKNNDASTRARRFP